MNPWDGCSGGEDWDSSSFQCDFCFLMGPVARGVQRGQGSGQRNGRGTAGPHRSLWVPEPPLLSRRCWDDYSSVYWWVIKAPILLAIFVSVLPESPTPEPGSCTARGPSQGTQPETWPPGTGELPHLPQRHQDVGTEDPVPGPQQNPQAAVHVRGQGCAHPGVPGQRDPPWRSTEHSPGASETCLSHRTSLGLRPRFWRGLRGQQEPPDPCPSPQEADQVHAAAHPPLRGALRGVRALP